MSKIALVVPSIRQEQLEQFLVAWADQIAAAEVDVYVIEDAPEKSFVLDESIKHYSHAEIEEDLGAKSWIISKKDSACRAYGFYKAWQDGAEIIVTLDDDVRPMAGEVNLFFGHADKLGTAESLAWEGTCELRTRGVPYKNANRKLPVGISHGLWQGVPDLDAMSQLVVGDWVDLGLLDKTIQVGRYYPMCGMNLAFRAELTPILFFPMMGEGQPYSRFDDIWAGIMSKKICDHLGYAVVSGHPHVMHLRASDPFNNLIKEAPGIKANEWFWEAVDEVTLRGGDPKGCYKELAAGLGLRVEQYMRNLSEAMLIWARLFD